MKAIALISGALDSILAATVVKKLGLEVEGVHFRVPFVLRTERAVREHERQIAQQSQESGVPIEIVYLGDEFLAMVRHPKFGRGKNMNPCIDCRIMMLRKAREIMEKRGASFLVTGEVVAQRPMSQHRNTMFRIEKEAGVEGLLLRPLSARVLPETVPEQRGWIDRSKLYDFNGRGRRQQIDAAIMLGLVHFPQPAGGCLLADPRFSHRLKDLIKSGEYDMPNVELLKVGRHFRLSPSARLVVGRDERDNAVITGLARQDDYILIPEESVAGPTALLRGVPSEETVQLAARIVSRYCDRGGGTSCGIVIRSSGEARAIVAEASPPAEFEPLRL